jgi:hypothetical protein
MNQSLIDELNGQFDAYQYHFKTKPFETAYNNGKIWMQIGIDVQKTNNSLTQSYVLLLFAMELFIKSLLLHNNIKYGYTHNINDLFSKLPPEIQNNIKKQVIVISLDIIDINNKILNTLNSFDEYLNYINNYFAELRYDHELQPGKAIIIPRHFINDLCYILYKECSETYGKAL